MLSNVILPVQIVVHYTVIDGELTINLCFHRVPDALEHGHQLKRVRLWAIVTRVVVERDLGALWLLFVEAKEGLITGKLFACVNKKLNDK